MRDTISRTADVRLRTNQPLLTLAAQYGLTEFVNLAPKDGFSTKTPYASLSLISAPPGQKAAPAKAATTATKLSMDIALKARTPLLFLKATFSAKFGMENSALNAPPDAFSTKTDSVFQ
jgi:hypothetical protein